MVDPAISILAKSVARLMEQLSDFPFKIIFRSRDFDVRKAQLELLQELSAAGVDAQLFDAMLSNELDRDLKKNFGIAFFLATVVFTAASYFIIVANSYYKWGISDWAITALIIETPLQFIGLLYIIARNLFPQHERRHPIRSTRLRPRPRGTASREDATAEPKGS